LNIFMLVGIIIILGFWGSKLCDLIHIPWVVGYIIVGVFVGPSVINLLNPNIVESLEIISVFALALIGFAIGSKLEIKEIKRLGRSMVLITFFESLGAFSLVFISLLLLTKNTALALIFGSLASATAPAATVDVLWQYKSKGPLTTTLFGVVGLDDATALIIYSFASSLAKVIISTKTLPLWKILEEPLAEIGGSLLLGALMGLTLSYLLKTIERKDRVLIITLGSVILCAGIANQYGLSLILSSMAFGFTLANLSAKNGPAFVQLSSIHPPIFLVFFILVGARMQVNLLPSIGLIGTTYLFMRIIGKFIGSYWGAVISKAPESVRKYLGFALLSQAGVAIGLAIDTLHTFRNYGPSGTKIGFLAINVIAATTFVYQVAGPPLAKFAIVKAGEVSEEYLK